MNEPGPEFLRACLQLGNSIRAFKEWHGRIVLAGGWVPFCYRHLPGWAASQRAPLLTFDMDWVMPTRLPPEDSGANLIDALRRNDFVSVPSVDRHPPVVRYQPSAMGQERLGPIHVELLTPLVGSGIGRGGTDRTLVEVQPNVRAQALRYLELLLYEPVAFDARCLPNVGLHEPVEIRVPNPGTFVVQKALIGPERKPDKRAKDAAYVYDLATLTEGRWADVACFVSSVRNSSPERAKWLERGSVWFGREYRSAESPLLGEAARILEASNPDEAPTPEALRRSLCRFLDAIGL